MTQQRWTATTSVIDITTNLWSDAFLAGRGGIWKTMPTATTTTKTITTTMVNEDNGKDPNSEDNDNLIFDTATNMWLDAFLAGRGGDFVNDDNGNNYGRERV
jgi:hypothetical protein